MYTKALLTVALLLFLNVSFSQNPTILNDIKNLDLSHVKAENVKHLGKKAVKFNKLDTAIKDGSKVVPIKNLDFKNGSIEVDLIGKLAKDAGKMARGFIGIAFRIDNENPENYECIYLRPTNSRAKDQLRRNHTVQYVSEPLYPWFRLRKESPSKYETYVDFDKETWTNIKIEVSGLTAKLFVNGVNQPTLIVNDLKFGEKSGKVGLWIGPGTEAYFSDLIVNTVN